MRISACRLHQLSLPFRTQFVHASASRASSDSVIVEIDAGTHRGYGEAIMREYVGGLPPGSSLIEAARAVLRPMIRSIAACSWAEARAAIETLPAAAAERPVLGALEAALMDAHCLESGVDVFALLGEEPLRTEIRYGAVMPMMPAEAARALLGRMRALAIASVRIKLGRDLGYNEAVLSLAREILGSGVTLRADVNSMWDPRALASQLEVCARYGVRLVEDPCPEPDLLAVGADPRFVFVADESFVSEADLERIAARRVYGMVNVRLAKNGGLLRSLALARQAAAAGLPYYLGCHVGETGVLSSLGRTAAALMVAPAEVDGSYDSQLLSDNITTVNFDFGPGGRAPVVRGAGVGYSVDPAKLRRYSTESAAVET